jgi:urease accessory protein
MTTPHCHNFLRAGTWAGPANDHVVLSYEGRLLRRKRLTTAAGLEFHVDLSETISLGTGDAFALPDGTLIEVVAASETLLEITGAALIRLAWHIGNRHTPCQIAPDRLLIAQDHVLSAMLLQLGATVRVVTEPFTPEGGAYGHGRTMGHSHGPETTPAAGGHDDNHSEAHSHSHAHAHADGHVHSHADGHAHSHDTASDHTHAHGANASPDVHRHHGIKPAAT